MYEKVTYWRYRGQGAYRYDMIYVCGQYMQASHEWIRATESEYTQQQSKENNMPGLTVGRMVHYVAPDYTHQAAVITNVWSGNVVNLSVFTNDPLKPVIVITSCAYSAEVEHDSWHWIERA